MLIPHLWVKSRSKSPRQRVELRSRHQLTMIPPTDQRMERVNERLTGGRR